MLERDYMTKSAEDILKTAILLEHRGKAFYRTAARETESEAVRQFFTMMAEEEDRHIEFLSRQFSEFEKRGKFADNIMGNPAADAETAMILTDKIKKEISAAGFEAAAISTLADLAGKGKALELGIGTGRIAILMMQPGQSTSAGASGEVRC